MDRYHHEYFHEWSWGEFGLESLKTPPPSRYEKLNQLMKTRTDLNSWCGGSFEHAQGLYAQGWPEGVEQIQDLVRDFTAESTSHMERISWVPDVEAAGNLDVARYLENEPECWLNPTMQIIAAQGKLVRILFNGAVSARISEETIFAHGAKVIALVNALELAGHSVEFHWTDTSFSSDQRTCRVTNIVHLKSFGEALDMSKVVYALCHPSMMRRLSFSVWENFPEQERLEIDACSHGTFGRPGNPPESILDTYDIYIPGINSATDVSAEQASEWIEEELEKLGVHITWGKES